MDFSFGNNKKNQFKLWKNVLSFTDPNKEICTEERSKDIPVFSLIFI